MPAEEADKGFCSKCGEHLPQEAKFCPACGASRTKVDRGPQIPQSQTGAQPESTLDSLLRRAAVLFGISFVISLISSSLDIITALVVICIEMAIIWVFYTYRANPKTAKSICLFLSILLGIWLVIYVVLSLSGKLPPAWGWIGVLADIVSFLLQVFTLGNLWKAYEKLEKGESQ
jgi:hypothetical protein